MSAEKLDSIQTSDPPYLIITDYEFFKRLGAWVEDGTVKWAYTPEAIRFDTEVPVPMNMASIPEELRNYGVTVRNDSETHAGGGELRVKMTWRIDVHAGGEVKTYRIVPEWRISIPSVDPGATYTLDSDTLLHEFGGFAIPIDTQKSILDELASVEFDEVVGLVPEKFTLELVTTGVGVTDTKEVEMRPWDYPGSPVRAPCFLADVVETDYWRTPRPEPYPTKQIIRKLVIRAVGRCSQANMRVIAVVRGAGVERKAVNVIDVSQYYIADKKTLRMFNVDVAERLTATLNLEGLGEATYTLYVVLLPDVNEAVT